MDPSQHGQIQQAWAEIDAETWKFDTATAVGLLPDLESWVVGRASESTRLLGRHGDRAIVVTVKPGEQPVSSSLSITDLRAVVRDVFTDVQLSHAVGSYVGRQTRDWVFTVGEIEVPVTTRRDPVYGTRNAGDGAADTQENGAWTPRSVEQNCRRLAFGGPMVEPT